MPTCEEQHRGRSLHRRQGTRRSTSRQYTESSSEEEEEVINRRSRKKEKTQFDRRAAPYTAFAQWYARSSQLDVAWLPVLVQGRSFIRKDWGRLQSETEFLKLNNTLIQIYNDLTNGVEAWKEDEWYFHSKLDRLKRLATMMSQAASQARSNDIASLKLPILQMIALDEPNANLEPLLHAKAKKSDRGFNHPVLARLLCPDRYIEEFEKNPQVVREQLAAGSLPVFPTNIPYLAWPRNSYDPEDTTFEMFRNPTLVRVFKHIFTSPSSALEDQPGQTKVKGSQSKINCMTSVTDGSIAYSLLQFRYAISSVTDYRIEDRLFKPKEFYDHILCILDDNKKEASDWYKDLIEWWNMHVFGERPTDLDLQNEADGLNTLDIIREQRRSKHARAQAASATSSNDLPAELNTNNSRQSNMSLPTTSSNHPNHSQSSSPGYPPRSSSRSHSHSRSRQQSYQPTASSRYHNRRRSSRSPNSRPYPHPRRHHHHHDSHTDTDNRSSQSRSQSRTNRRPHARRGYHHDRSRSRSQSHHRRSRSPQASRRQSGSGGSLNNRNQPTTTNDTSQQLGSQHNTTTVTPSNSLGSSHQHQVPQPRSDPIPPTAGPIIDPALLALGLGGLPGGPSGQYPPMNYLPQSWPTNAGHPIQSASRQ